MGLFGQKPQVFRNTEMIYSDEIGAQVYQMGYKAILTEGAVMCWVEKSEFFICKCHQSPNESADAKF
jgi:alpha-amylase